jgi:uncharacterized peroxidase-related enzyme
MSDEVVRPVPFFLETPPETPGARRLFDADTDELGFVMNVSRLWAYQPDMVEHLFGLMRDASIAADLSVRQRGILVAATASTLRDSYCSVAWGTKLAKSADPDTAAGVLRGDDDQLTPAEHAMAHWARMITDDPGRAEAHDVEALREVGFTDDQIFAITAFVALRIAFSTVNASLGALPDASFRTNAPRAVLDAVTYGRPLEV